MPENVITVGIDLGTTNTLASYQPKGKQKIIRIDGNDMVTSAIYVQEDGTIVVGHSAVNFGIADPDNFIRSAKTHMGSDWKKTCRGRTFTATDVATEVLKTVRAAIVKKMKCEDDATIQAVITVPAYFNSNQTEETRLAGEHAGFHVLGIITEPMAAALYAAQDEEIEERQRVLVADLGGGTFDLSVLEADPLQHEYNAIDTGGDNHLGGDDFDKLVFEHFLEQVKEDIGCDLTNRAASGLGEAQFHQVRGRLYNEAVKAKEWLSENKDKKVLVPNLMTYRGKPRDFIYLLDQSKFYEICQPLFDKIETRIRRFLEDGTASGKFQRKDISQVILAGGSCNIPKIQDDIARLTGLPVNAERNLDKLVVFGANLFAEYKAGGMDTLQIHDILSHSLGVRIVEDDGDQLSKIIEKGEVYPVERTSRYQTEYAGQTVAEIDIYEAGADAEDTLPIDAHDYYGTIELDHLVPDQEGKPSIDVTFSYDASRCLTVTVEDIITHQKKALKIDKSHAKVKTRHSHVPPIDFALLIDASWSMNGDSITEAKRAGHMLIDDLIDFHTHRMGIISFGSFSCVQAEFTNDQHLLRDSIDAITPDGSTNLVDAMRDMERMFQNSGDRRRVGIIVSDGMPDWKEASIDLSRKLRKDGVRMIFIGAGSDFQDLDVADPEDKYTIHDMRELESLFPEVIHGITAAN